jgi:hypothetical protein
VDKLNLAFRNGHASDDLAEAGLLVKVMTALMLTLAVTLTPSVLYLLVYTGISLFS